MTPETVASEIGMPVESWPGKCHEIAGLCLVAGVTTGTLRYGLWHGPVKGKRDGLPIHHGWVEVDPSAADMDIDVCEHCPHVDDEHEANGILRACTIEGCDCQEFMPNQTGPRVFDPTRWVFEEKKPYLFDAEDDFGYYDVAGDRQRALTSEPLSEKIAKKKAVTLAVDLSTQFHLIELLSARSSLARPSRNGLRMPEVVAAWLAIQPMSKLGPFAEPLYKALAKVGLRAAIPIDCRELVFGDGFYGQRAKFEARIARARATKPRKAVGQ